MVLDNVWTSHIDYCILNLSTKTLSWTKEYVVKHMFVYNYVAVSFIPLASKVTMPLLRFPDFMGMANFGPPFHFAQGP